MKHLKLNTKQWLELGKKMGYLDKVSQVRMDTSQNNPSIAPSVQQQETGQATTPPYPKKGGWNISEVYCSGGEFDKTKSH